MNIRYRLHYSICRVSIRKTFAKFFRKETQNFSFFAHQFCAKTQKFSQSFAKVISRKIALLRFCETQVLRNSATRVLRNSAIQCAFLIIQLVQCWKVCIGVNCPKIKKMTYNPTFDFGAIYIHREGFVPKSETDCPVKVSTILVLDMHIS